MIPARSGPTVPPCGPHVGPGGVDEAARRLSHEEVAVARMLAAEGHDVRSQGERPGARRADLEVCGRSVEVKSWLPSHERGRTPGPRSVVNKLVSAGRQADSVVLWARGSGLSVEHARAGLAAFAEHRTDAHPSDARVVGDGWELSLSADQLRRRPPDRGGRPPGGRSL